MPSKNKNQPAAIVKVSPSATLLHSAASSSDKETITVMQGSQGKKQKQQWNGRTWTKQQCSTAIGISGKSKGQSNTLFLKKEINLQHTGGQQQQLWQSGNRIFYKSNKINLCFSLYCVSYVTCRRPYLKSSKMLLPTSLCELENGGHNCNNRLDCYALLMIALSKNENVLLMRLLNLKITAWI